MPGFVVTTGDMIQITMTPPAIVPQLMAPIPLIGSSTAVTVMKKPVCLKGDELPPAISGPMPYMYGPYTIPGMGSLSIILTPANLTLQTKNGMPMLIGGSPFQVMFQVQAPAQLPPPASSPDPLPVKPGTGQFITTNVIVKAG